MDTWIHMDCMASGPMAAVEYLISHRFCLLIALVVCVTLGFTLMFFRFKDGRKPAQLALTLITVFVDQNNDNDVPLCATVC
jgi:hypothetical protein